MVTAALDVATTMAADVDASILSVPAIQFGQYGDNALFIETEFGDDRS